MDSCTDIGNLGKSLSRTLMVIYIFINTAYISAQMCTAKRKHHLMNVCVVANSEMFFKTKFTKQDKETLAV